MQYWTPEMDDALRANVGQMTYAQIGKMLGVSRSAISGRMCRLGLSVPAGPRAKARLTPEEKAARDRARKLKWNLMRAARRAEKPEKKVVRIIGCRPERVAIYRQRMTEADVTPLHISLFDLEPGQCRYPYGDGPFTFCGCHAAVGSYCEPHHNLTHSSARLTIEELVQSKRAFRRKMIAEAA